MRIIVLGAGRIGQYVAQGLLRDDHNVTLVDSRRESLDEASQKMDVAIKVGRATDVALLGELMHEHPELLLALTDNDEANIVACSIARALGSFQSKVNSKAHSNFRTIARIQSPHYLSRDNFDLGRLFHIDHIVIPDLLVANQLATCALNYGLYSENFFHGAAHLRTIILPVHWKHSGKTLAEIRTLEKRLMVALIRRKTDSSASSPLPKDLIIFPHGQDALFSGDEVTFIGNRNLDGEIDKLLGNSSPEPRSALIMGGELTAIHLAKELESRNVKVRLGDSSKERCYELARELPNCSILYTQGSDWDFLKAEKVGQVDVFVACTPIEEKNMQLSLFAKEQGCSKVISVFSDQATRRLAEKLGIYHAISPRIAATDRILTLAKREKLTSMLSLYDQRAEIIEVKVSQNSPLVGIPLSLLGPRLPPEILIAAIYSKGKLFIAGGNHILSPKDEALVICHPLHRKFLEEYF